MFDAKAFFETCRACKQSQAASPDRQKVRLNQYQCFNFHLKYASIVFSCWKATLDILEPMLLQHGIKYFRIDGNVSNIERTTTVQQFQENPEVNVLLMTTGTGAVGYQISNLTRYIFKSSFSFQAQFDRRNTRPPR